MEVKKNNSDMNSFISESQSLQLLDAMIDFIRVLDKDGNVLFENQSLLQYCYNELETTDQIEDASRGISVRILPSEMSQETLETGNITNTELSVKGRVFSVKCSPIFDDDGEIDGCIELLRDITESNNLTVQLYQDNQNIKEQMLLARSIQRSMLPQITDFGEIHFDYKYIPSEELSGDFFDLIPLGAGRLGLYISDVVGHGISASILTMFVRQTMRNILEEKKVTEPSEVLPKVRKRFEELELDESQYFSLFYAVIDTFNRTITYANAGHNCMPLLYRNNQVETLDSTGMLISPIFDSAEYSQNTIRMEAGYQFLFFTDGIIETVNVNREPFGFDRLSDILAAHHEKPLDVMVDSVNEYRQGDQKDDIALLLIQMPNE